MVDVAGEPRSSSGATSGRAAGAGGDTVPPVSGEDWPAKITETIVRYVQTVRRSTTGRALVASRAAVYLLAVALIGIVALILAAILLFRLLAELSQDNIWAVYLGFGVLFTAIGLFAWAQKERSVHRAR